jgi:hypothetical protein
VEKLEERFNHRGHREHREKSNRFFKFLVFPLWPWVISVVENSFCPATVAEKKV